MSVLKFPLLTFAGILLLHAADQSLRGPSPFPVNRLEVRSVLLDKDGKASLAEGKVDDALAWGSFSDAINKTGWAVLDIHSSPIADGGTQSYAAGFLEGALTHARITQHLTNMWGVDFKGYAAGTVPEEIRTFISENMAWMVQNVVANSGDSYWQTLGFLLAQLRGMADGYEFARERRAGELPLTVEEMLMLVMVDTDMDDLVTALVTKGHFINQHFLHRRHKRRHRIFDPFPDLLTTQERRHHGHCSAVVQCGPGMSDLWVTHATWDEYRAMLRMVKYMDMPLPGVAARRMSFSANPGSLYSADDFYVIDTGLTVLETTIDNYNTSLWKHVKPATLMTWARAMISNRLATTGEEWTEYQVRHNSGTCNNQWMVVDYKLFTPGKPLQDGLLWISETMPGYSQRGDVTQVLRQQGSWPSYNIPYFKDVWTVAGYGAMRAKMHSADARNEFSFTESPRARMFARARKDGLGKSLSSLMHLIRYNHIGDPLAIGDACNGISARCDLNPVQHQSYDCFGAVDAKIAKWRPSSDDLSFLGVSAPTRSHGERAFSWSSVNTKVDGCKPDEHIGHPDTFDFGWHVFPASWPSPASETQLVSLEHLPMLSVLASGSKTQIAILSLALACSILALLSAVICTLRRALYSRDAAESLHYHAIAD